MLSLSYIYVGNIRWGGWTACHCCFRTEQIARFGWSLLQFQKLAKLPKHLYSERIGMIEHKVSRFLGITAVVLFWSSTGSCQVSQPAEARAKLVREELESAGISNPRVLEAIRTAPRHEFVPLHLRKYSYQDVALPIGSGQTISPPFVVAYMTEALDPKSTDKVLEIGTGSGYQASVLAELCKEVYSIEIVPALGRKAAQALRKLKYRNVHTKIGDGYLGWPEHAPFDKILVTCSPESVPKALIDQLKEGGRMVIPVGTRYHQTTYLLKKENGKMVSEGLRPTLFVPMTGQAEKRRVIKPDPANPAAYNGTFEKLMPDRKVPDGWHYQRQLVHVTSELAPQGERYILFSNKIAGRDAHALQGFAVDGRQVKSLDLSLQVRGDTIRYGRSRTQIPRIVITFFDARRALVGTMKVGDWRDTFPWREERFKIPVPPTAREAIIRIGLLGGTGEIALDDLKIAPSKK